MSHLPAKLHSITMAGSFDVVTVPFDSPTPVDIGFRQISGVVSTAEEDAFALKVTARLRAVKRIFSFNAKYPEDPRFRKVYFELLSIAKSGVQHPDGVLRQGQLGLDEFEKGALDELGSDYRLRFFKNQLVYCAVTLVAGVLAVLLAFLGNHYEQGFDKPIRAFGFDLIGIAITVSLAALWRNRVITWANIGYLDPAGYPPALRILGIVLLSLVMMMLLYKKALILGVGSIELNKFLDSRTDSMIVGCFCGLSEMPAVKIIQGLFDAAKVKSGG